jgi:hypothetical protein
MLHGYGVLASKSLALLLLRRDPLLISSPCRLKNGDIGDPIGEEIVLILAVRLNPHFFLSVILHHFSSQLSSADKNGTTTPT